MIISSTKTFSILYILGLFSFSLTAQAMWRGLIVEPEHRCSPYDKKTQYPYSQSLEDALTASMNGNVYGPYTGLYFEADTLTDIEHIIAASEAHDSGLCSASQKMRKEFSSDLLNLTLAHRFTNRCSKSYGKCGLDAGEWLPLENKCWFANRVIEVKRKYKLSVDQKEAKALESVLAKCETFEIVYFDKRDKRTVRRNSQDKVDFAYSNQVGATVYRKQADALALYDDNKNGRITCKEARSHGITPVSKEHSAYPYMRDGNGDGIVCEKG